MENTIENPRAVTDKHNPPCLTVSGKVMTYRGDDKLEVQKGLTGIDDTILILDIVLKEGSGPMKGTLKDFEYRSCENIAKYKQVTLRYKEGKDVTIGIELDSKTA